MFLEFKPRDTNALDHGLLLALGYALEMLKIEMELYRSFTRRYVIYAMSSGGQLLFVGKVELVDYKITLYGPSIASPSHGLSLIHAKKVDTTIPLGIQALYALVDKDYPREPGAVIDGYQLLEVLGFGSFCTAAVATVVADALATEVVVKIPRFLVTESGAAKCLKTEFDILKKLNQASNCSHIPTLHNTTFKTCIAFKDRGVPLNEFLYELAATERPEFTRTCITQLLAGIDFAHSQGICHRDLRVENIIALPTEQSAAHVRIQIIDWGLTSNLGDCHHAQIGGILYFHDDLVGQGNLSEV